jgi:hypothetical protein
MAERFRMVFLAKGRACRGGGAREVVEGLPGELRLWSVLSAVYDIAWMKQGKGEIQVISVG